MNLARGTTGRHGLLWSVFLMLSFTGAASGQESTLRLTPRESGTDALLQAVSPVDGDTVWVSGHEGTWGRSLDGGRTWVTEVVPGHEALQFRDVEGFDSRTAVLMSAGEGALSRLFRTEDGGATWTETFVMDHPAGFLDCMTFLDRERGFVYGDAVDMQLYLLETVNGGRSWSRVDPSRLPPALEGEGGFAASGACITSVGGEVYVASGNGPRPRLIELDSPEAIDLPLTAGPGAGATALGLFPDGWGFAVGGAIGEPVEGPRVVVTRDGGRIWAPGGEPAVEGPLYGAARAGEALVAVGPGGLTWSPDGGSRWLLADTATYWAVEFATRARGWAVGPGGRITELRFETNR